jgi:DNA-binding transcriptional MerR regulator
MSDDREAGPLRPGALARLAGVSKDTLRYYERKGLLASRRSSNGYREYPPQALGRVHLVQRSLSVGFTLDELAQLLAIRQRGGAPCRRVRALAATKLEAIEGQLRELRALRVGLRALLAEWDDRLAKTARGKRAWLLESWSRDSSPASTERATALRILKGRHRSPEAR